VLLTSHDLALRGCESLFGYADRRRGVAVVSTFRLGGDGEALRRERTTKVIAHERGHLEGLRHCRTPGCVMHPARSVADLDARGLAPCERCRRPRLGWRRALAAAVVCAGFFAGLDALARTVKVKSPPFSVRAGRDRAVVLYKREAVMRLGDQSRARAFAQSLNSLYAQISPPPLEAVGAAIRAGGATLVELDGTDANGDDPVRFARNWVTRMEPLMRAKGTEAEGCPDCHIRRLAEVREAVRNRERRRW
jgi:hypothetical protein